MIRPFTSIKPASLRAIASPFQIWSGVIVGTGFAVALYLFLASALLSVAWIPHGRSYLFGGCYDFANIYWQGLLEPVRFSYLAYLLLAGMSLAAGMGAALRIWFVHRGEAEAGLGRLRRHWVRNESTYAPWVWLWFLLEFGWVSLVVFLLAFTKVFLEFTGEGVWPVLYGVAVLLPVALFLQLWIAPRLAVRSGRLMFYSLLVFVAAAPALALIKPAGPLDVQYQRVLMDLQERIQMQVYYQTWYFEDRVGRWPDRDELTATLTMPELSLDADTAWSARLVETLEIQSIAPHSPDSASISFSLKDFRVGNAVAFLESEVHLRKEGRIRWGDFFVIQGELRTHDGQIVTDISGSWGGRGRFLACD